MEKGFWVRKCIVAGGVFLILGVFTRIWSHYQNINPARLDEFFGITADAFLRFADTCLLIGIALGIYQLLCSKD